MVQKPRKCPFVPTRHELIQLVKYWYGRLLDVDWYWFLYALTGSIEVRLRVFAYRRIGRAATAIGQEAVNRAIEEVREEFRKSTDKRLGRSSRMEHRRNGKPLGSKNGHALIKNT